MSEIKPALTAEEWAEFLDPANSQYVRIMYRNMSDHAGAAVSLHEQPFGFTREMVKAIRDLAIGATYGAPPGLMEVASPSVVNARAAADRIEALLSPEEQNATQGHSEE